MVTIKAAADECGVTKKIGFSRKLRFKKETVFVDKNVSIENFPEKRNKKFSLKRFFRWKQEKPPEVIEFDSGYGESLQQKLFRKPPQQRASCEIIFYRFNNGLSSNNKKKSVKQEGGVW